MSRNSMGSPTSRSKQGFLAGRKEEEILLIYPFGGDDELIEKCAKRLNEASRGGPYNADSSSEKVVVKAMEIDSIDLEVSDKGKASSGGSNKGEAEPEVKTRGRAHFLTVRVEDLCKSDQQKTRVECRMLLWAWVRCCRRIQINRCLGGRGTRQSRKLGVHYPGRRNQRKPGCCDQSISRSSCFVGREKNPVLLLNTKAW
jgi:hypothetical protein